MLRRLRWLQFVFCLFVFTGCATVAPSLPPKPLSATSESYGEDFIWPLKGKVISGFGQKVNNAVNKGIDIQPYKQLEVVASRSGKVVFYNNDFLDLGKTIIIEHPDGFWTVYGRNEEVFVKIGDNIKKGINIARVGRAGRDKNIYLHFEIRKGHIPQNPNFYLP
jgi:murein DD-endopeptidase MepM/ murein hydrolase activator NlpD